MGRCRRVTNKRQDEHPRQQGTAETEMDCRGEKPVQSWSKWANSLISDKALVNIQDDPGSTRCDCAKGVASRILPNGNAGECNEVNYSIGEGAKQ